MHLNEDGYSEDETGEGLENEEDETGEGLEKEEDNPGEGVINIDEDIVYIIMC